MFATHTLAVVLLALGGCASSAKVAQDSIPESPENNGCFEGLGCLEKSQVKFTPYPMPPEAINVSYMIFNSRDPNQLDAHFLYSQDEALFRHLGCLGSEDPDDPQDETPNHSWRNMTVLIHGFSEDMETQTNTPFVHMKNGIISNLANVQSGEHLVLVVNWADGARPPDYPLAAVNTRLVGRQLGLLLSNMVERGCISPENIHMIGFSLGAHISGYVGRDAFHRHGIKLGRITALDPAGPLFENYGNASISPEDASFVDAIHTSAGNMLTGHYGMKRAVGHADFYPAGGSEQPRCEGWFNWLNLPCKHDSACVYYLISLERKCQFSALRCDSYEHFQAGKCSEKEQDYYYMSGDEEENLAQKPQIPIVTNMGYWTDSLARGRYFLQVSKDFPYCLPAGKSDE